jgi:hypothetical protein
MKKLIVILCALYGLTLQAQDIIPLAGFWDFSVGESASFNDKDSSYVMLPGSMLTNGKGDLVSVNTQWTGSLYDSSYFFNPYMQQYRVERKFPFFLTPERHYVGKAWYHKKVYVPKEWKGRRMTLFLERPHIETTVWVNGKEVGHQMSLSTPHRYDVTSKINVGEPNDITICVYNGIENVCVGQDSHSVTDQTQGNWNGIAGRIELQAQWKKLNIRHVRIIPSSDMQTFKVVVELENHVPGLRMLPLNDYFVAVTVREISPDGTPQPRTLRQAKKNVEGLDKVEFEFSVFGLVSHRPSKGDLRLWDEFNPQLYQLTVEGGEDVFEMNFGLRNVSIKGRQLCINRRPLFLRGTVENCCFPETGYPPTTVSEWMRIFMKCKEYGLNHVRFHSYCPPEAAFAAADHVGIYLQPEGPSWPNHGVRLRRGMAIDKYLLEESKRIIDEYGHHPSFLMMAAGNEPAGDWVNYCNDWVREMHAYDSTKVYCGASVGGGWAWDSGSEYHVKGGARGLAWDNHAPSSDDDYYSQIEFPRNYKQSIANNSPIIAHEQGQWCAFPDFKEVSQYTGVYKPHNFEIFRDLLRSGGMESQAENFLMASGKLQTLCYKYEIERNLRTKDYAGFQLLGLNDYSGQGTALVGPLNVHWQEKGYVNASQWREFCSILVPLARFPKFVYTNDETLVVPVEAYNAFSANVDSVHATYYITKDNEVVTGGQLFSGMIPIGKNMPLGIVRFALEGIQKPAKLTLTVQFSKQWQNHWDFWVYPSLSGDSRLSGDSGLPGESGITITSDHKKALTALQQGGKVLLLAAGKVTLGSDVKQTYLPVFWNTSWFKMRPPHTTGAFIDTNHPLFKYDFPTDDWSNVNWWELLNKAQVMNLRELPASYQSPIQPIDTWHVSRKLGMLIEAKVGKGQLLITTMDLTTDLKHRHVARQMRQAVLRYMQSADFQPSLMLTPDVVDHFFTRQAPPVNMFTNESPDELKPKLAP